MVKHMYSEGPFPLYISYVSPEQIKHDRHQETQEPARDKRPMNKKITKVNESK